MEVIRYKRWKEAITATATAAAIGVVPACSESVNDIPRKSKEQLVFADEFTKRRLDTRKWMTCYPWAGGDSVPGCTVSDNKELEWYQADNVSINEGILQLTGKKERMTNPQGEKFSYTSGMVASRQAWQYGRTEIRAKVPRGKGLWPALWQLPQDGSFPPEIDMMEVLGDKPDVAYLNLYWGDKKNPQREGSTYKGVDLSKEFHTYGLEWKPDSLRWLIDGETVKEYTNKDTIPQKPMYILANLAIGGTWPGNPNTSTSFPADFQVDYVRVYQKR